MIIRVLFLLFVLILYGISFISLDRTMQNKPVELLPPPPLKLLQVASGYLRQITAEMLFIKTSIFLGGVKAGTDEAEYETVLAKNFNTITSLYPEFTDPYFFTESFLAPISEHSAHEANIILNKGIETFPDNFIFRFFYAFNYYRYMNQPLLAAKAFEESAKREGAPPSFAHLATIFSAHGGQLKAGLIMLHSMLNGESNETVRKRYMEEIELFKKAITVENAIKSYKKDNNSPPRQLEDLVPKYLSYLPIIEKRFVLVYEAPNLYLKRP